MITRDGGHLGLGIALGVFCTTFVLLFLDLVALPFTIADGVVGAIVGGFIAGGVAIAGQVLVILAELNVLEKADQKQEKLAAQGIFLKCQSMHDYARKAHNYYRTFELTSVLSMQTVHPSGQFSSPRYLWKPLRSKKTVIGFEQTEKQFALDIKNSELLNVLGDLENSFELLLFIEEEYTRKFDDFERIHVRANTMNLTGKHVQSQGSVNPLDIMELEDLLTHLRSLAVSSLRNVSEATVKVTGVLKKDHKINIELEEAVDAGGAIYNH